MGSFGSGPEIASSMAAASAALRVMGPTWSNVGPRSNMPKRLTRPQVGLMPVSPLAAHGNRMDPPVSDPSEPSKARPRWRRPSRRTRSRPSVRRPTGFWAV